MRQRKYYSEKDAHLIANSPEWLRLLVERVRKQEHLEIIVRQYLDGGRDEKIVAVTAMREFRDKEST